MLQGIRATISPMVDTVINQGKKYLKSPNCLELTTLTLALSIFTVLTAYLGKKIYASHSPASKDIKPSFKDVNTLIMTLPGGELYKKQKCHYITESLSNLYLSLKDKPKVLSIKLFDGTILENLTYKKFTHQKQANYEVDFEGYFNPNGDGVGQKTVTKVENTLICIEVQCGEFKNKALNGLGKITKNRDTYSQELIGIFYNGTLREAFGLIKD